MSNGQIFAVFFPSMVFFLNRLLAFRGQYAIHSRWAGIAAPAVLDPASLNWVSFLWKNMVPATIGNIIGGGVFVGMSYWGAYLRPSAEDKGKAN